MPRGQSPYQGQYTVPIHDYGAIERGGAAWGEAFKDVGQSIGAGIEKYKLKKEENKILKGKRDALIKRATGMEGEVESGVYSDDEETNKRMAETIKDAARGIKDDPDKSLRQQIAELEIGLEGWRFSIGAMQRKRPTPPTPPMSDIEVLQNIPPSPLPPPPGIGGVAPQPPSAPPLPMPADLTPEEAVGMGGPAAGAALGATPDMEEDLASIFAGGPAAAYASGVAEPTPSYMPPDEEEIPDAEVVQIERDPKYVQNTTNTQGDAKRNLARIEKWMANNPADASRPGVIRARNELEELASRPKTMGDAQKLMADMEKSLPHGKKVNFTVRHDAKTGVEVTASISGVDADIRPASKRTADGTFAWIPGLFRLKGDDNFWHYDPKNPDDLVSLGFTSGHAVDSRRLALERGMEAIIDTPLATTDPESERGITMQDFITISKNAATEITDENHWYLEYVWYDSNNIERDEEITIDPYARNKKGDVVMKDGKPVHAKWFKDATKELERYDNYNEQLKGLGELFDAGPPRLPVPRGQQAPPPPQPPRAPQPPPVPQGVDIDRARRLIGAGGLK